MQSSLSLPSYLVDALLPEERRQASEALLLEGELALLKGDWERGNEAFDRAAELDPSCAELFYRQGLSLFEFGTDGNHEKGLLLSGKKFKSATQIAPEYFDAWQAWGSSLLSLGRLTKQHHYFQDAKEKIGKATLLSEKQTKETLAELYWDCAAVHAHLAEHSGESLDFHLAIEAFEKSAQFWDQLPAEFWREFGIACMELATRINDLPLFVKSINCFRHAISHETHFAEGWISLASALEKLYGISHDEDHFSQANECFACAAQLKPQDGMLWLSWAKFLSEAGRRNGDIKRLRSCIEKCHRAYGCLPNNSQIQGVWAEALSFLGDLTERVDLLNDAYNKTSLATERSPEDPEVWYSAGICMQAFGKYFNDLDYYYQAIERLQEGISIDRRCHRHWHAIAQTYTILGQIEEDPEPLEKSLRFYSRAIDLSVSSFYIFDYALALSRLGEMTREQRWLEESISQFERALAIQKNAIYLHPHWLFHYACTLDLLGDFYEEDSYYLKAIEILSHVLMIDPDFHDVHRHIGLAYCHLGELTGEVEPFHRALHHFRLAAKQDEENDVVILDWGLTLIHIAEHTSDPTEADGAYRDAEHKLIHAAKLGNLHAYYHLGGLYSILGQYPRAMYFLEKADEFDSLPTLDEIMQDDWLEPLRSTPDFRHFLSNLEQRPNLPGER